MYCWSNWCVVTFVGRGINTRRSLCMLRHCEPLLPSSKPPSEKHVTPLYGMLRHCTACYAIVRHVMPLFGMLCHCSPPHEPLPVESLRSDALSPLHNHSTHVSPSVKIRLLRHHIDQRKLRTPTCTRSYTKQRHQPTPTTDEERQHYTTII